MSSANAVELAEKAHDECVKLCSELTLDGSTTCYQLMAPYYLHLIELLGSYLALAKLGHPSGTQSIFRTFLECYVELTNLDSDENYWLYVYANYHAEQKKFLGADPKTNPVMALMVASPVVAESKSKHEAALKKLKLRGYSKLSVKERFEKADMLTEYETLYCMESGGTHADLRALIKRHFINNGDHIRFGVYEPCRAEEFNVRLGLMLKLLLSAARRTHRRFGSGIPAVLVELEDAESRLL